MADLSLSSCSLGVLKLFVSVAVVRHDIFFHFSDLKPHINSWDLAVGARVRFCWEVPVDFCRFRFASFAKFRSQETKKDQVGGLARFCWIQ